MTCFYQIFIMSDSGSIICLSISYQGLTVYSLIFQGWENSEDINRRKSSENVKQEKKEKHLRMRNKKRKKTLRMKNNNKSNGARRY